MQPHASGRVQFFIVPKTILIVCIGALLLAALLPIAPIVFALIAVAIVAFDLTVAVLPRRDVTLHVQTVALRSLPPFRAPPSRRLR